MDENWMQTGTGLCNIVTPALLTPFFCYKFSIFLHLGPWLLQKVWPLAGRNLADTMFSKTRIYWIHAAKCPKSIGLLLGEAMMSLLRIWPSNVPAKRGNQVQSLGTGSLLLTATPRCLNELEHSELGTETSGEVAPPSWTPKPRLKQAVGPFSRASSRLSPASATQPCTSAGSHEMSLVLWESKKCQIWSGPKWVAKFLKILTQALYLWASAIIWTGERQKWAAVAPAIPWNSSVHHPDYCMPFLISNRCINHCFLSVWLLSTCF